jgi:hypothetical protein
MHIYFLARGIYFQVEQFKMFMQTQMWKWTRLNLGTKQEEIVQVQGSLRTAGFLWEYVIPEEDLPELLTILDAKENLKRWNLGKFKNMILRFSMGKGDAGNRVEKIPEYTPVVTNKYIPLNGVALYLIGIKKDGWNEMFDDVLKKRMWQEML